MEEASYGTETAVSDIGMMNLNLDPLLVCVLTAGVSGSARLHEKLGNGEALRAVDRCVKRIERSVNAFGGRIASIGGDEVMATFDSVDAALQSAIEMQQRVADLPPVSGVKIAIRVGISSEYASPDEGLSKEVAKEAAILAGLAKPAQILASAKISKLIPSALADHVINLGSALATETGANEPVLEIVVPENHATHHIVAAEQGSRKPENPGCLALRYAGETILLNDSNPIIRMGRDTGCDIVIHDRRASRLHATIERRSNAIVLIDKSTNGTYVASGDRPEQFVRRREHILQGSGQIAFASSSTNPDADVAEFELS